MVKGSNRLSPAAAMSLNRGCEERPSKRKEGWEVGTEGAGAGAGPPGNRESNTPGFLFTLFYQIQCTLLLNRSRLDTSHSHWWQTQVYTRSLHCSKRGNREL